VTPVTSPRASFLTSKFSALEKGEEVVDHFNCALQSKVLLQGMLYVTNQNLYFYSPFNNKTLLGTETTIKIGYGSIVFVGKALSQLFFPNMIKIIQNNGAPEVVFTSFISRDKCFSTIEHQRQLFKAKNQSLAIPEALRASNPASSLMKHTNTV
jgi:hypothetical protein